MSTATATPAATVEQALAAAPGMMTVPQLRTKTGLDEKTVRAELRRLAGLGQIEHIPGRGRYDGRYGLTTARAEGASESEGGEADVKSADKELLTVPPDESKQRVAAGVDDNADPEPGDDLTARAVKLAVRNHNKRLDAQAEEFTLLGVLADIRAAIGDPDGKIMLGDLADAVRARVDGAQMAGDTVLDLQAMLSERQRTVESLTSMIASASELLAPWVPGGLDTSDMDLEEIAERAAAGVTDLVVALADKGDELRAHATLIADLRSEIARLKSEAVALAALEESMPGFGAAHQDRQKVAGYLVRAPKRPMRTFAKSESAQSAALAAARNGSGRGEVFALVPVGLAVRGAEWRPV